ncbi:MAG: DUF4105 domain-containing protein [Burkholderiales bacterium]|nr:DUF4105 domain-containing protein [Burkholderiales bacterium]
MMRVCASVALTLLGVSIIAAGAWGTLALAYAGPPNEILRSSLAAAYAFASLAALIGFAMRGRRWRALGAFVLLFALLLAWWSGVEPSNNRDWQTDVALLPRATIDGELVTLHNIRNFDYRSETDYTPAYYDKRYDVSKLEGVDLVAAYWMGPAIAHTFMSFSFAGGDRLAISIETRKEKGEGYSTLKGFFRQYELYYVVADERDLIRLRTNYRRDPPEDVYVYRLQGSLANARRLFMAYAKQINALGQNPAFYNTLTTNCTTNIWVHSRINPDHLPFSWKILASGYLPQYLYEHGLLASGGLAFADLQRRVHVNARAQAADAAADFSRRIRVPAQ